MLVCFVGNTFSMTYVFWLIITKMVEESREKKRKAPLIKKLNETIDGKFKLSILSQYLLCQGSMC